MSDFVDKHKKVTSLQSPSPHNDVKNEGSNTNSSSQTSRHAVKGLRLRKKHKKKRTQKHNSKKGTTKAKKKKRRKKSRKDGRKKRKKHDSHVYCASDNSFTSHDSMRDTTSSNSVDSSNAKTNICLSEEGNDYKQEIRTKKRKRSKKKRRYASHDRQSHPATFSAKHQNALLCAIRAGDWLKVSKALTRKGVLPDLPAGTIPESKDMKSGDAYNPKINHEQNHTAGNETSSTDEICDESAADVALRLRRCPLHEAVLLWHTRMPTNDSSCQMPEAVQSMQRVRVCVALLQSKANVNCADIRGNTPLHLACKYGDASLVGLLISKGADDMLRNNAGETPYSLGSDGLKLRWERQQAAIKRDRNVAFEVKQFRQDASNEKQAEAAAWQAKLMTAENDALARHDGGGDFKHFHMKQKWAREWEDVEREAEIQARRAFERVEAKLDSDKQRLLKHRQRRKEMARKRAKKRPATKSTPKVDAGSPSVAHGWNAGESLPSYARRSAQQTLPNHHQPQRQQQQHGEMDLPLQRKQMDDAYTKFDSMLKENKSYKIISDENLPWPNGPGENIFALPKTDAMTCVDRKKTLRTLQLRWHPDKIQQKWGRRWAGKPEEWNDVVMERVRGIAQAVNALKSKYAAFESNA